MSDETGRGADKEPSVSGVPTDLAVVLVLTMLALGFVYLPVLREHPFRFVFGFLLVVLLPGYSVVAAVFPARKKPGDSPHRTQGNEQSDGLVLGLSTPREGIDSVERVVLSIGVSCVIVALIGLLLNYTRWGITLEPLSVVLTVIIVVMTGIGAERRWRLPKQARYRAPYGPWFASVYSEFSNSDSRTETVLNIAIVVSVLVIASSFVYAVSVPHDGEQFTELSLLTEDDGELVADDYPRQFTRGETRSVVVGLSNHEHETVEYTVVVELQQVSDRGEDTVVLQSVELDRLNATLAHNQTEYLTSEVTPTTTGERQRLAFMLYLGDPPARPSLDSAYRSGYLWVDVSDGETANNETRQDR